MGMQLRLNPCSSSSAATSPSTLHNGAPYFCKKFNFLPFRTQPLNWVSGIYSRIQPRKHFEVFSSNGFPLNAVSVQDGELVLHLKEKKM